MWQYVHSAQNVNIAQLPALSAGLEKNTRFFNKKK